MPEDIETIFPKLFNMKWNNGAKIGKSEMSKNEAFMSDKEQLNKLIGRMNKQLKCKYFKGFRQSFK